VHCECFGKLLPGVGYSLLVSDLLDEDVDSRCSIPREQLARLIQHVLCSNELC